MKYVVVSPKKWREVCDANGYTKNDIMFCCYFAPIEANVVTRALWRDDDTPTAILLNTFLKCLKVSPKFEAAVIGKVD